MAASYVCWQQGTVGSQESGKWQHFNLWHAAVPTTCPASLPRRGASCCGTQSGSGAGGTGHQLSTSRQKRAGHLNLKKQRWQDPANRKNQTWTPSLEGLPTWVMTYHCQKIPGPPDLPGCSFSLKCQLCPFCCWCFCALWKQGGQFITEHGQPGAWGARASVSYVCGNSAFTLRPRLFLTFKHHTLRLKKKKGAGLADFNSFCFGVALAARLL